MKMPRGWRIAWLSLSLFAASPAARAGESAPRTLILFTPARPLVLALDIRVGGRPLDEAYRRHVEQLLENEDRDRDGKFSFDAATRIQQLLTGAASSPAALAAAWKLGEPPPAEIAIQQVLAGLAATAPALALEQGAGAGRISGPALFPLLDTDGDGFLSRDELQACERLLGSRDFDDDGVISAAELALDNKPTGLAGEGAAEPTVAAIGTDGDAAALVDAVLARYDRDGDGQLDCTPGGELALPPELISRLDQNGDGRLARDEIAAWIGRPDVTLAFDFGFGAPRTGRGRRPRDADEVRVHAKLDGGYRVSLPGAQIDFRRDNRNPAQAAGDAFRLAAFDADANGYLDEAEIKNVPLAGATLAAMDEDGDGKVFAKEFKAFVDRQGAATAGRLLLTAVDQGHDLFALLDTDRDGRLTRREMRAAVDALAAADRDGDGRLGATEIPRQFQLELVRGTGSETTSTVMTAARPRNRPASSAAASGPAWFLAADRNGDGDLSPNEFLGPPEAFATLDADGDGLISAAEASAAK